MHQHPKFHKVASECQRYPEFAEQLFQVYLDLTEAKGFEDVVVIDAPLLGLHLIQGKNVDNGNGYTILPVLATASWSVAQMDGLFSTLEKEQDPRLQAASVTKITLALIAADSTLTYVDMTRS